MTANVLGYVRRLSKASLQEACAAALYAVKGGDSWETVGDIADATGEAVRGWAMQTAKMPLQAFLRLDAHYGSAFSWPITALTGKRLVSVAFCERPDTTALSRLDLRLRETEERDLAALTPDIDAAQELLDNLRVRMTAQRNMR